MKKLVMVIVIMVVALAAALSGCTSAAENLEENKYGVTQLSDDCYQFVADKYYKNIEVYYQETLDGKYHKIEYGRLRCQFVPLEGDNVSHTLYKNDILRIGLSDEIYSIKIVSEYDDSTYYIYYVQTGEYEAS